MASGWNRCVYSGGPCVDINLGDYHSCRLQA